MIDAKDLLERVDIIEYISQYAELKEKGREYWCCSPLTSKDHTPSFSVDKEKQMFYCFSTGCGGNIFSFIMEYHHVNFKQAIEILCKYCGVDPNDIQTPMQILQELRKYQPKIRKNMELERKELHYSFLDNYKCDNIKEWQKEGISQEIMTKYNIGYDREKEAITIPIYDNNGKLINIHGRNTSKAYKEMGLPKYFYYFKMGVLDFLWGLNFKRDIIKQKKEVLIFEGEKSVLLSEQYGYPNSIAILTSHLNEYQLKLLIELQVNIVFCMDKDINILKDNNIMCLKRFGNVFHVKDIHNILDEKMSPVDKGKNVFDKLYSERRKV